MKDKTSQLQLGAQQLIARTGHIARQASGAVTLQLGETLVLVTVCCSKSAKEGQDFFPLTVEYQEKTYAGGTIPGGFFKREGKSTEKEVLTSRLTDRPIRPLFPEAYLNEVQIISQVLSSDNTNEPDILSINGASIALLLSEAPFMGPVGAVRVAEIDGKFILNPTYDQMAQATLDLVVAGTRDGVTMIESEAKEITESHMVEALKFGHEAIKKLCDFQEEFVKGIAKEKVKVSDDEGNVELEKQVRELAVKAYDDINKNPKTKEARDAAIDEFNKKLVEKFVTEDSEVSAKEVIQISHDVEYSTVREFCIRQRTRVDGRKPDEIRKITSEVSFLPCTHGSAIFTRGQTQSLGVVTLGTSRDEQMIESYEGKLNRRFMLHYNFPPFSVGETKMMRGPGRREIGHGALAKRGLEYVIPSKEEFPYTIRLVSEILESNGSSSMASICSGTLALMDAGVPIKAPVSGIAMGLIKEGKDWVVLSDIAGVEDHLGDMDFKVAGTSKGITTLQLDIKLKEGLEFSILEKALDQAQAGRAHILKEMLKTMTTTRTELSKNAPRIITVQVKTDQIGEVIGPGGKVIRKITADSGSEVEIDDTGLVRIFSKDSESARKAKEMVEAIVATAEVGKVYPGTVKRVVEFGAFIEIMPGKEGLCHVSELSNTYIEKVEDAVKEGDQFDVRVINVDQQGRIKLSRKAVDNYDPEAYAAQAAQRKPSRGRSENGKGSSSGRGRRF